MPRPKPRVKAKAVIARKRRRRGLGATPMGNDDIAEMYGRAALAASTCAEAWPLVEAGRLHYLANSNTSARSYDVEGIFKKAVDRTLDLCKRK
jgi:hypothetical protein